MKRDSEAIIYGAVGRDALWLPWRNLADCGKRCKRFVGDDACIVPQTGLAQSFAPTYGKQPRADTVNSCYDVVPGTVKTVPYRTLYDVLQTYKNSVGRDALIPPWRNLADCGKRCK